MEINLSLFKIKSYVISLLVMLDIFALTIISNAVEANKVTADCRNIQDIADNSIVKIDHFDDFSGSGVIIAKQNNIYTVLTVAHAVKSQEILDYDRLTIQSQYGQHNVIDGQLLDHTSQFLDLAIIRFQSSRNYIPITFTSSQQTEQGKNVYLLGYPLPHIDPNPPKPEIKQIKTTLIRKIYKRPRGYDMRYSSDTSSGMSGGAILDVCGRLLGIHGRGDSPGDVELRTEIDERIPIIPFKGDFASGIPIDYFINLLPLATLQKSDLDINLKPLPKRLLDQDRDNSYIIVGFSELDARNYQSAIKKFTKSIEQDPKNYQPIAYFYRGLSYSSIEDKQKAVNDYSTAIRLDNNLLSARYNRGLIFARDFGYYDEALKDFEELIKRNPRDADALLQRGNIYFQRGNKQQALNDYTTAISLNKQLGDAFHYRGIIYHQQNKNEEALEDLRRAKDIFALERNLQKFERANNAILDIQGGVKR
ncbi:MAG: tetratricopeptide repeat-containing serine protease family protein [Crocosphaera sp.]|nr:tetratricopeptide repeat-containing serine protease family protein [Crocosphaera sp.]